MRDCPMQHRRPGRNLPACHAFTEDEFEQRANYNGLKHRHTEMGACKTGRGQITHSYARYGGQNAR